MNLLMLTRYYPFGTGEAFVENEIKVMSEIYNQIVIIACEVSKDDVDVRSVPDNVKVYKVPATSKKINAIKGLLSKNNGFEYKDERESCKRLIEKAFLAYFEEKSQRAFKYIIRNNYLKDLQNEPFVLYSYWLFMTARVGTLISDYLKPVMMFSRAHRYDLYEDKNRTNYLPYRNLFLEKYDYVFPCSDNGTQYLKNNYPEKAGNVQTALLGTLEHGMGKSSTDGIFRIISCSRMEKVKRVEKIVDALALLESKTLKIEWTHIGTGSEFNKVKNIAKEKLHVIKYHFLGNMKNTEVMQLYANQPFDLFLNVSSSEGLPVSIMEALSFGLPCVGTDVGGTSEIVIDDVTGELIQNDFKDEQLAEIIEKFVMKTETQITRENCRKFWEHHFQAIANYRRLHEKIKKESSIIDY